ncbi:MAG: theronine dehydrogenase, partial [Verrucomicrobiota bacterium]
MSISARSLRLVFPAKQQVHTETGDLPPLHAGEVLVRTQFSLMSTGTENIVFNRLFDPGTHWDNWVKYPFYPGYSAVGIVEASEAPAFKPGDRVAARANHQSRFVQPADECYPIPEDLSFEQALWFALAKIAWHGARAADYKLGDSVLIVGAGPIGQMSIRWARAAGATTILVVDAAPERMALATAGGASAVIPLPIDRA